MANNFRSKKSPILYENRFCAQKKFDDVSSELDEAVETYQVEDVYVETRSFCARIKLAVSTSTYRSLGTWLMRSQEEKIHLKKHLAKHDWLTKLAHFFDKKINYTACCFMKNLYVLGGYCDVKFKYTSICAKYNTKSGKWSHIASLNQRKGYAECTIFEGKIVTLGGCERNYLKVVEAYDYYDKKWIFLPNMIYARCNFGAFGMGNKLVAIGGAKLTYYTDSNGEIFDKYSRKFTIIKEMQKIFGNNYPLYHVKLFAKGCNVIICSRSFERSLKKNVFYDVINNKLEVKSTDLL